jgi:murein DD-endopeptidase MepM/ murein hydrolase activator NlpD
MRLPSTVLVISMAASAQAATDSDPLPAPAQSSAIAAPPSVADLDRELGELTRRESALRKELDQVTAQARALHSRAVAGGRLYVRMARVGLLPVSTGFDDFVAHIGRLERLRAALGRDVAAKHKLAARGAALAKELQGVSARRARFETEHRTLARAEDVLLAARERELAFERAFSQSGSAYTAVYGGAAGPADPSELSAGFAHTKGRLPFPLPGRTEIRSARRAGGGPGLEMRAARGSPVRAVYPGRVGFADSYADFGRAVIVDHGDGHYTVSGNLEEIDVRVGDPVSTGTRLGTVGRSGDSWLVYFEIRAGTDTLDPAEWFGI